MPRCSVVIPAYNAMATIADCIASVLRQTVSDLEILVVDDASTDKTVETVRGLAETDGRIRLLTQEKNGGVAEARNRGVKEAAADWVAFLDSDDMWLPEKLEEQFALQEKTGAALVVSGASCIDGSGQLLKREFRVPAVIYRKKLLSGNDIICSSVLVRREAMLRYPMERSDLHEDLISWYRITGEEGPARCVRKPLVLYRVSQSSKSGNKLKSARMHWNTCGYLGISPAKRLLCMSGYICHGLKRYLL